MKVTLIARTETTPEIEQLLTWNGAVSADYLAEVAGRSCYQAWQRKNPATASNAAYLGHIIDVEHESVLEHASATFYLEGISRSLTHELIRHRHLSFSQQSQRYVDESNSAFIDPPLFKDFYSEFPDVGLKDSIDEIHRVAREARDAYANFVEDATALGVSHKKAREAARSILPNGTETRIVVSGNLRAWRWVIKLRHSEHADAEINELSGLILAQLKTIAPNTVADLCL